MSVSDVFARWRLGVCSVGSTSLQIHQRAVSTRTEKTLLEAVTLSILVDPTTRKPTPFPDDFRKTLRVRNSIISAEHIHEGKIMGVLPRMQHRDDPTLILTGVTKWPNTPNGTWPFHLQTEMGRYVSDYFRLPPEMAKHPCQKLGVSPHFVPPVSNTRRLEIRLKKMFVDGGDS